MKRISTLLFALMVVVGFSLSESLSQVNTFSTIFGVFPTFGEAQSEAENVQALGNNWTPIEFSPDIFPATEGQSPVYAFFKWHDCPQDRPSDVFVLINSEQVPFRLSEASEPAIKHHINFESDIALDSELHLPILDLGLHSFSLVFIPDEGECFSYPDGYIPRTIIDITSKSILVGLNDTPAATNNRPIDEKFVEAQEGSFFNSSSIWFGTMPEPFNLRRITLQAGEPFEFYLYARNHDYELVEEWALVMFMDNIQIPVNATVNPDRNVENIRMPARHELSLPISMIAPSEPGVYRLVAMMRGEPYKPVSPETSFSPTLTNRNIFEITVEAVDD